MVVIEQPRGHCPPVFLWLFEKVRIQEPQGLKRCGSSVQAKKASYLKKVTCVIIEKINLD